MDVKGACGTWGPSWMKWTGYVLDVGALLVSGVLGSEGQEAY
jgi:hypothetical protein